MKFKHQLMLSGALVVGVMGMTAPAYAQSRPAASAAATNTIEELVVTAEKRAQSLQDVPVAVSAFTDAKRELVGINSIQDMTNFTPGLQYNSSTDRVSLRGVGRQTNVLSADASVANYNDGVYETFAVQAGRSTLFLDRVEVLRGPQGTLYGRNSIGGAINEISKRPTDTPFAEVRASYANYNHSTFEAAVSGPITSNIQARLAGDWEKQTKGWIHNIVPGQPDEGNVINEWFLEGQVQGKFFNDKLDVWVKYAGGQWYNGAGGPGSQSGGWTQAPYPIFEGGAGPTELNNGYGCNPNTTNVVNKSPLGCVNPQQNSPWTVARTQPYKVDLPHYATFAGHLTWHADKFDIRYITGGVDYHYHLTGPTGPAGAPNTAAAPITSYTLPGGLVIHPNESFDYREYNSFWSHEINILSSGDAPLQYVAGAYLFNQHYTQPVFTQNPDQTQWNGPFGAPGFFCAQTGGVCAPETKYRRFDNKPDVNAESWALFGQLDYKWTPEWKFTAGLRYSHDRKYGTESVRILCFAAPACFAGPELAPFIPGGIPVVDLTQLPTVVSAPAGTAADPLPRGVTTKTTYDAATGFASRHYDADWGATTGTLGVEWQPDHDTNAYAKYSRGYKSGGFNIGIFTVLTNVPYTDKEIVDSFEVGLKKTFNQNFQANLALFRYDYKNLQIPIASVSTAGGLSQGSTNFYNVPKAISQGFEAELTWQPIDNLQFLFNYSYLDAYVDTGTAIDIADPAALDPAAKPLQTVAQCTAAAATPTPCPADVFSAGVTNGGFQRFQSLSGNRLPNSAKNKLAFNVNYTWHLDVGNVSASASYIWRDKQYGTLFTRSYTEAPSWSQVDARVTWISKDSKTKGILFVKNLFEEIGYDAGAVGYRYAGFVNSAGGTPSIINQGTFRNYSVTPPRTYGIELQYKFF
ncbi:TonB-dependent receptor domain-containing protein [Phenylobacterium sp.]|uniref:TonB-dependent receptor domain-containing protein n=1 Tax=Phenylobacterium sp. TaxID=1871053 RepID=UPI00374CBDF2